MNADDDDRLGETMPFLFEIVANLRNGLDVDKRVGLRWLPRVLTCDLLDSTIS